MSDVGVPAGASGSGPRQVQLNPERAPALIAKYQKMLGKDLKKIQVEYTSTGVSVWVWGMGDYAHTNGNGQETGYSLSAFKQKKSEAAKPSEEEALTAFKNKWEIRLNTPFPADAGIDDASEASIQTFLAGRPFNQRRAMLMSNKQFRSAYPNGYRQE
jgi:hypothetical protein